MDKQIERILIYEIRENRKGIDAIRTKELPAIRKEMCSMKQSIFANKTKLSIFIGAVTLFSSIVWAIILEKLKTYL